MAYTTGYTVIQPTLLTEEQHNLINTILNTDNDIFDVYVSNWFVDVKEFNTLDKDTYFIIEYETEDNEKGTFHIYKDVYEDVQDTVIKNKPVHTVFTSIKGLENTFTRTYYRVELSNFTEEQIETLRILAYSVSGQEAEREEIEVSLDWLIDKSKEWSLDTLHLELINVPLKPNLTIMIQGN